MNEFLYQSELAFAPETVFAWHEREGALTRMMPPWEAARVRERMGTIRDGDRTVVVVRVGPLRLPWTAVHFGYKPPEQFCDRQESGPFARWEHTHRFLALDAGGTRLMDRVEFALPLGPLGHVADGLVLRRLQRMFSFRHDRLRRDLERHAAVGGEPRRVAISGASGLVGTQLAAFLSGGGHEVFRLVRSKAERGRDIAWDPARGTMDAAALEGMDAVVHLAGENIGARRWNASIKRDIVRSREAGTRLLAQTVASLRRPPSVFLSASAIGFYGHREEEVDEKDRPGQGFLADVCSAWEAAAEPARTAATRLVRLRIGVALSAAGGALQKMVTPFMCGVGGPVGNGRQGFSWIDLDDVVYAIHYLLFGCVADGVINAVAPNAVSNARFAASLGRVLHRPAWAPLPAPIVRTLFGEMGQCLLLEGARVRPTELSRLGYSFAFPDLEGALRHQLGR